MHFLNLAVAFLWALNFSVGHRYESFFSFFIIFLLFVGVALYFWENLWNRMLPHVPFAEVNRSLGIFAVLGALYAMGFKHFGFVISTEMSQQAASPSIFLMLIPPLIFAILMIAADIFLEKRNLDQKIREGVAAIIILVLGGSQILFPELPPGVSPHSYRSETTLFYPLVFIVAFFLVDIWLIMQSVLRNSVPQLNISLLFFVLGIVTRYFDFFWDLMPKSIFFMAGGVFLLVGGYWIEKTRRRAIGQFHREPPGKPEPEIVEVTS